LRLDRRRVTGETEDGFISLLEDVFLFDEFVQISFDFLFAHDVERLVVSDLIGFHLVLGLSVENIFERGVSARSFAFLVDIEDFWQFVDVGKRRFFL
jgi:hypothetical protein